MRDVTERVRAEAALQASEARYRATFEVGSVGMALTDRKGVFLETNPALAEILGYDSHELIGKFFSELTHPDDVETSVAALHALQQGQQCIRMEERYLKKNGSVVWVDVSVAVLRDPQGEATQFVTHVIDISERKRIEDRLRQDEEALRASEHFARSTVDALVAHIAILDEAGSVITVNSAWRQFALANPVITSNVNEGANYLEVCDMAQGHDAQSAYEFAAGIRAVLRCEQDEFTLEYSCSSPEEVRWFTGHVTRYPDLGVKRVVVTHENITKRKQAEEATKESSTFLTTHFECGTGADLLQGLESSLPWCQQGVDGILQQVGV